MAPSPPYGAAPAPCKHNSKFEYDFYYHQDSGIRLEDQPSSSK